MLFRSFIAMQGWNKKGMTFVPYSNFYEFIPEEEWLKSKDDKGYQPSTVLLDAVEEGKTYEIVITNFHGGPFFRYRLGDLIKICSLKDEETGVNLPQMIFQSRTDDIINIAGSDPAHLKPPHIGAPDTAISDLLYLSQES